MHTNLFSRKNDENAEITELVRLRRMFHKNPEPGFAEFWTTARIAEYLDGLNCRLLYGDRLKDELPDKELFHEKQDEAAYRSALETHPNDEWIEKIQGVTGLVAIIKGEAEGPKFGFRFDIDALPIQEAKDDSHLPFREGFHSRNGHMHACGHDGHIAVGLGLARKLASNTARLKGEYYLLFQPAEELISGGKIFSKLNFVKDLDYFIPVHLGLVGERKVVCGLSFLSDRRYRVSFNGESSHSAAFPEKGNNALLAACHAATALYGISRHSGGYSRVNIGHFNSGNATNIISDKAEFELDLRGESDDVCDYMVSQADAIISGASRMQNVKYDMALLTEAETADNSPELISQMNRACLDIGIAGDRIIDHHLIPASEDATFIMNEVLRNGGLSTYVGVGCCTFGGHHNNKFDLDEEVLPVGVNLLYQFAMNALQCNEYPGKSKIAG